MFSNSSPSCSTSRALLGGRPASSLSSDAARSRLMTEEQAREWEESHEFIQCPQAMVDSCEKDPTMTTLDLSYRSLHSVPNNLVRCEHCTTLNLQNNYLEQLPDDLGCLCNLKVFMLHNNHLREIPPSLCMCECLEVLDVGHNQLSSLPIELADLQHLQALRLDYNQFDAVPDCVLHGMSALARLSMVENPNLKALPVQLRDRAVPLLEICLDNSPSLVEQAQALVQLDSRREGDLAECNPKSANGQITFQWNRIYPDQIVPGVFLGSVRTVQSSRVFSTLSITHVLTCARNVPVQLDPGMKHLVLPVDDDDSEQLSKYFFDAIAFIREALQSHSSVIIHCFAGVSRSATVTAAFLMVEKNLSCEDALKLIKLRRPVIAPNAGFCRQLCSFERELMSTPRK